MYLPNGFIYILCHVVELVLFIKALIIPLVKHYCFGERFRGYGCSAVVSEDSHSRVEDVTFKRAFDV
jgi:hypothetical protein